MVKMVNLLCVFYQFKKSYIETQRIKNSQGNLENEVPDEYQNIYTWASLVVQVVGALYS